MILTAEDQVFKNKNLQLIKNLFNLNQKKSSQSLDNSVMMYLNT